MRQTLPVLPTVLLSYEQLLETLYYVILATYLDVVKEKVSLTADGNSSPTYRGCGCPVDTSAKGRSTDRTDR